MINCGRIKKDLVAFLSGELDEARRAAVESHCSACPRCRAEREELAVLLKTAETARPEIAAAMASIDWDSLSEEVARDVFASAERTEARPEMGRRPAFFFRPAWRPVMGGLAAGLVLGALAAFLVLRPPRSGFQGEPGFVAPPGFLDSVELELTRRQTIDYLDKSEYLLLDLLQANSDQAGQVMSGDLSGQRIRELLSQKKYINEQLGQFKMAKAKAICDQIEILFFELSQVQDTLSPAELRQLQQYIADKQILLKIRMVKKELKQNEV